MSYTKSRIFFIILNELEKKLANLCAEKNHLVIVLKAKEEYLKEGACFDPHMSKKAVEEIRLRLQEIGREWTHLEKTQKQCKRHVKWMILKTNIRSCFCVSLFC